MIRAFHQKVQIIGPSHTFEISTLPYWHFHVHFQHLKASKYQTQICNVIRASSDKKISFKASFLLVKTNQVKPLDFYVLIVYISIC